MRAALVAVFVVALATVVATNAGSSRVARQKNGNLFVSIIPQNRAPEWGWWAVTPSGLVRKLRGNPPEKMNPAPDGARIAFNYGPGVSVSATDGSRRRTVARGRVGYDWAPDGKRLVLVRRAEVVILHLASGRKQRIRRVRPWPGYAVAWSPRGSRIAVNGISRAGVAVPGSLEVITEDGTRIRRFPGLRAELGPAPWSPTGEELVVATPRRIYLLNPKSGRVRRVARGGGASFSPVARRVLFSSTAETPPLLRWAILDLDRGTTRRLPWRGDAATWSPDGRFVAYTGERGVEIVRANGLGARQVFKAVPLTAEIAWAPARG